MLDTSDCPRAPGNTAVLTRRARLEQVTDRYTVVWEGGAAPSYPDHWPFWPVSAARCFATRLEEERSNGAHDPSAHLQPNASAAAVC
jgi:hypothetical protein